MSPERDGECGSDTDIVIAGSMNFWSGAEDGRAMGLHKDAQQNRRTNVRALKFDSTYRVIYPILFYPMMQFHDGSSLLDETLGSLMLNDSVFCSSVLIGALQSPESHDSHQNLFCVVFNLGPSSGAERSLPIFHAHRRCIPRLASRMYLPKKQHDDQMTIASDTT